MNKDESIYSTHQLLSIITKEDLISSATLHLLTDLLKLLNRVKGSGKKVMRMLDLGCGYGGLSLLVARYMNASEVYGVDIEEDRIQKSEARGIKAFKCDLEKDKLPFPDAHFQLLTTFGVLDHLSFWDNVMSESYRVLERGGYFIISITNLSNIFDRIAFLFGFQPRHVEISRVRVFGVPRIYHAYPILHVHTATCKALKEMLEHYGFRVLMVKGSTKIVGPWSGLTGKLLRLLYKIVATCRPTMALRLFVLAEKPNTHD